MVAEFNVDNLFAAELTKWTSTIRKKWSYSPNNNGVQTEQDIVNIGESLYINNALRETISPL